MYLALQHVWPFINFRNLKLGHNFVSNSLVLWPGTCASTKGQEELPELPTIAWNLGTCFEHLFVTHISLIRALFETGSDFFWTQNSRGT